MRLSLAMVLTLLAAPAFAAPDCGGDFRPWLGRIKAELTSSGQDAAKVDRFFQSAKRDPKVIEADRAQSIFQRSFTEFSRNLISQGRLRTAKAKAEEHSAIFDRAEQDFGISREILLAFWAFETDFGSVQGNFNTLNALVTLAHDCRRPELFRPQVLAAYRLWDQGGFSIDTTGAWAGEIGMVQMLPADVLTKGVDGDADGKISLKTSVADAILSGAKVLQSHGWRAGEPWLQEVTLPETLDWSLTGIDKNRPVTDWAAMGVAPRQGNMSEGLEASVLLPQGKGGPAFLAYPNFSVLFEWNKSFVYVTTTAYFATRIGGAPVFEAGSPSPALSGDQMKALQTRLKARGHDVGAVDGILGAMTRAAVQTEQARLGLAADGWPTRALLDGL